MKEKIASSVDHRGQDSRKLEANTIKKFVFMNYARLNMKSEILKCIKISGKWRKNLNQN